MARKPASKSWRKAAESRTGIAPKPAGGKKDVAIVIEIGRKPKVKK